MQVSQHGRTGFAGTQLPVMPQAAMPRCMATCLSGRFTSTNFFKY